MHPLPGSTELGIGLIGVLALASAFGFWLGTRGPNEWPWRWFYGTKKGHKP